MDKYLTYSVVERKDPQNPMRRLRQEVRPASGNSRREYNRRVR